jgi:hypothetical protein
MIDSPITTFAWCGRMHPIPSKAASWLNPEFSIELEPVQVAEACGAACRSLEHHV